MLLGSQSQTERANRLRALRLEVTAIEEESRRRTQVVPGAGVRRDAPLPTDAWLATVSSSALHLFDASLVGAMSAFYRRVEGANYLAGQSPMYVLIAQTANTEEERAMFLDEAREASSSSFVGLADRAVALLGELPER
jgi:hypothetical protein